MNRTVRILERAKTDVDAIFDWIVPRSVEGAISWYLAFRRAVDRIGETPELYGVAPESNRLHRVVRQAMFRTRRGRTYRILFEVNDNEVVVLRVRGRGQPPLSRRDFPES
jgi:plasmid stabilization system protein ParE